MTRAINFSVARLAALALTSVIALAGCGGGAETTTNPVTTGLFVQSLNEMIDAYASTVAEIDRHVPEFVLFLLYGAFIVSGGVIGYASGLANHRPALVTYLMVGVIALLLYMVMDLDRPGRGVIRVSVQSLLDLQAGMKPELP